MAACATYAYFRLAFASAPGVRPLNLATESNSLAHSPKGTQSGSFPLAVPLALLLLVSTWFQVLFTPVTPVLFTFPSRYLFTIGRKEYLALEGGPPCFPQD
jgi:hypothetical protein